MNNTLEGINTRITEAEEPGMTQKTEWWKINASKQNMNEKNMNSKNE